MGLRDIGSTLPPGFRFYPSDEELVCHYLYKKIANEDVLKGTLVEIDLHTCEPWQLPEVAKLNSNEYYFFSFRDRKYATGYRTNRATTSGYWKATGKDRTVLDPKTRATVGMRKTLVFYKNRAPNGIKTGWIMHEFRLENPHIPPKEDWVLCRVFYKAKGENSNESIYDNTIDHATSPNMDTSPPLTADCQPLPCGGYHHQITTSSFSHQSPSLHHQNQNFLGLSSQCNHPNFLQPPRETMLKETMVDQTTLSSNNNKCEDQYGFFFDMGFEEDMPSHLHDLGFEDDVNNDGMVFFV